MDVRLEPLTAAHAPELFVAASDDAIWRFMPNPRPETLEAMQAWIAARLAHGEAFGVIVDGIAAGSTSLYDWGDQNRRCEVGWTWYASAHWGTGINEAVKRIILGYAFDKGARRVQLKCDARNQRSFAAMAKFANHDGTLRQFDEMWDGHIRDAELFSVLDEEWPSIRERFEALCVEKRVTWSSI